MRERWLNAKKADHKKGIKVVGTTFLKQAYLKKLRYFFCIPIHILSILVL